MSSHTLMAVNRDLRKKVETLEGVLVKMKEQRDQAIKEDLLGLGHKMDEAMKINKEQAEELQATQEALKIVKDENEVNKKNMLHWQKKCQELGSRLETTALERDGALDDIDELKAKFRKDMEHMAEQMTIPIKKELAEAEREKYKAHLEGAFEVWADRGNDCPHWDAYELAQFLVRTARGPCSIKIAQEVFDEQWGYGDESVYRMDDKGEIAEWYMDDEGDYTLTQEQWDEKMVEEGAKELLTPK